MFKKSLSVVLAILMAFSVFSVSAFANTEETPATPEPVTYTAQYTTRVKTDIVLLSAVKNELTVIHPGDAVKFIDQKGNYVNKPLTVTYYADVDALLKKDVKNTAFLASRFDSYENNIYKDVTASSASGALFFQDNLAVTEGTTDTINNAHYTVKGLGDLSTSYCNVGEFLAEQGIDYSFDSNGDKFIGWVAETARAATTGNTLTLYALWEKDARAGYVVKSEFPEGKTTEKVYYGYVGEQVTVSPDEITGYITQEGNQVITLDADSSKNEVKFVYDILNIKYTVNYVDASNNVLKEAEILEAQEGTTVKAEAAKIDGYSAKTSEATLTLSRDDEAPSITFVYEPVLEPEDEPFIRRLKRWILTEIIDFLYQFDWFQELLDKVLVDELDLSVADIVDMLIEIGLSELLIRLVPVLKELIPFDMIWDALGI